MEKVQMTPGKYTTRTSTSEDLIPEIYFLISKFLSDGPCKQASEALKRELRDNKLIPNRIDWTGNPREQSYDEYSAKNNEVTPNTLVELLEKLGPAVQKILPLHPAREESLLSRSLLRQNKDFYKIYKYVRCTLKRDLRERIEPFKSKGTPNIVLALASRELLGVARKKPFITNSLYEKIQLLTRNVGHLSAVYCVLYDRHGRYIFTGADDMLVKVWSVIDGRLVATLRGLTAEVTDIDIDYANTMLAAGSTDKVVRIWDLQTLAPIAVYSNPSGMITALQFCPFNPVGDEEGLLIFTGGDGCVGFWNKLCSGGEGTSQPGESSERRSSSGGQNPDHSYAVSVNHDLLSPREGRVGSRRVGDIEGVRQSRGNWEKDNSVKAHSSTSIKPLVGGSLKSHDEWRAALVEMEIGTYEEEKSKSPVAKPIPMDPSPSPEVPRMRRRNNKNHSYSTRSMRPAPSRRSIGSDFEDPDLVPSAHEDDHSASEQSVHGEEFAESSSSSEEEGHQSTDYSDWTAEAGVNLEPPRRTAHKQKTTVDARLRRRESPVDSEESSEDSDRPSAPAPKAPPKPRVKKNPIPNKEVFGALKEVPEPYRLPEWLCETLPKKAPYYPQMGDLLIYCRQGHKMYADAVSSRKLYEMDERSLPWMRKQDLKEEEFVKIIGMKYEIKPPRVVCLKLGILDSEATLTGESFTIKYHDMADVLDFLVLKPAYDVALSRDWNPGDRFRCIIDDAWWSGTVEGQEPHLPEFPDSRFLCYKVLWDNGEQERLSPWDMEPINKDMDTPQDGGSITVQPQEYQSLLYTSWSEEWNSRSFKSECERIAERLGAVMELAAAEPFLAPVDLNAYPAYAMVIEYPMDLSTIKSRLENHFYRRPNAVQFDVRYIATNAEIFNEQGSNIVRNARIITDLCLEIIRNPNAIDPPTFYHDAQANYVSPPHSGDESGPSSSRGRSRRNASQDSIVHVDNRTWQQKCKDLLRTIFEREDSLPFRYPVNEITYPDYNQVIDQPMDLTGVREELEGHGYQTPLEFAKDLRLIFENSKNYNTNKRSKIYSMTLRLEAYCEEQLKRILDHRTNKGKVARRELSKTSSSQYSVWDTPGLYPEPIQPHRISISLSRSGGRDHDGGGSYWVANLQAGPSQSSRHTKVQNGLTTDDATSDDESGAPRTLRNRRENGHRRSRRVASRHYGTHDSRRSSAEDATKGGPFKRGPRRYEDDSDFEVAEPAAKRPYEEGSEVTGPEDEADGLPEVNGHDNSDVFTKRRRIESSESENEYQALLNAQEIIPAPVDVPPQLVIPSSPEVENSQESDYNFKSDEESEEDTESDEDRRRRPRRPIVVAPRKQKAPVLDGDDQDDADFSGDDEVDDEVSSESSSESDSSLSESSSSLNARRKKHPVDRNKNNRVRKKAKQPQATRRPNGNKSNSRKEKRTYSSSDYNYDSGGPASSKESGDSSVGRRGRVRKRVRYAEDESDDDGLDVSSRGRVRQANTRMRDFI